MKSLYALTLTIIIGASLVLSGNHLFNKKGEHVGHIASQVKSLVGKDLNEQALQEAVEKIHNDGLTVQSWLKNALEAQEQQVIDALQKEASISKKELTDILNKIDKFEKNLKQNELYGKNLSVSYDENSFNPDELKKISTSEVKKLIEDCYKESKLKCPLRVVKQNEGRFSSSWFDEDGYIPVGLLQLGQDFIHGSFDQKKHIALHELTHLRNLDGFVQGIIAEEINRINPSVNTDRLQVNQFHEYRADQLPAIKNPDNIDCIVSAMKQEFVDGNPSQNQAEHAFELERFKCIKTIAALYGTEKQLQNPSPTNSLKIA